MCIMFAPSHVHLILYYYIDVLYSVHTTTWHDLSQFNSYRMVLQLPHRKVLSLPKTIMERTLLLI